MKAVQSYARISFYVQHMSYCKSNQHKVEGGNKNQATQCWQSHPSNPTNIHGSLNTAH